MRILKRQLYRRIHAEIGKPNFNENVAKIFLELLENYIVSKNNDETKKFQNWHALISKSLDSAFNGSQLKTFFDQEMVSKLISLFSDHVRVF